MNKDCALYKKRYVLPFFVIFFVFIFSSNTFAQSVTTEKNINCGMIISENGAEIVEPFNGQICKDDLAFQGLYLAYSKIINLKPFQIMISWMVEDGTLDSEFTQFADRQINASEYIYAILSAIAMFSWFVLLLPLFAYKVGFFIYHAVKVGKLEINHSKNELVSYISYFAFLVILILPVGSVMVGQGFFVVSNVAAIKGGNFLFSTYLNSTQISSGNIELDEKINNYDADIMSANLIKTQLCQQRTQKAIMTENAKKGTPFFSNGLWGIDFTMTNQGDLITRYSKCLGYIETQKNNGDADKWVTELTFVKYNNLNTACYSENTGTPIPDRIVGDFYKPESYGMQHDCGSVKYRYGMDLQLYQDNETFMNDVDSLKDKYSTSKFYKIFKDRVTNSIKTTLESDLDEVDKEKEIHRIFDDAGKGLFPLYFKNDNVLSTGTESERKAKYIVASSLLLGAYRESTFFTNNMVDNGEFGYSLYRVREALKEKDPHIKYGVDYLIDDARDAAENIIKYNCVKNWSKNQDTRQFVANFNRADNSALPSLFAGNFANFECVKFLKEDERGNDLFTKYARYSGYSPLINSDINIDTQNDNTVNVKQLTTEQLNELTKKIESDLAKTYYDKSLLSKVVLSGYIEQVKKHTVLSINEVISKEQQENDIDRNLRSKGFGIFGGVLLYTGKNFESSKKINNSIQNSIDVDAPDVGNDYVNYLAFDSKTREKAILDIQDKFSPIDTDGILGVSDYSSLDLTKVKSQNEQESTAVNKFYSMIEWMLFDPIKHLKNASGMDIDKSLGEGLKTCMMQGYDHCLSGKIHPLIALSNFGHDMVENSINLMMLSVAVNMTNKLIYGEKEGKGKLSGALNTEGEGFFSKLFKKAVNLVSKLGKVVKVIISLVGVISIIAGIILQTLMPLIISLFVMGAFFGYFLPMMAFLYGFMALLFWIVGSMVATAVLPIYVFFKFKDFEMVYQRGFMDFYQDFIGNPLKPLLFSLSAVISWTMITIAFFLINIVFAFVYDSVLTEGSKYSLVGIVSEGIVYILYLLAIFIVMRLLLKLMISLSDQFLKKMKINGANDEQYVESLAFEQYVNAQILRQMANSGVNFGRDLGNKFLSKKDSRNVLKKQNDELKKSIKEMDQLRSMIDSTGGIDNLSEIVRQHQDNQKDELVQNAKSNEDGVNVAQTEQSPIDGVNVSGKQTGDDNLNNGVDVSKNNQ